MVGGTVELVDARIEGQVQESSVFSRIRSDYLPLKDSKLIFSLELMQCT